ncbi:MAG: hypothetical protein ACODAD_07160 [Planctomycetota bacterium]
MIEIDQLYVVSLARYHDIRRLDVAVDDFETVDELYTCLEGETPITPVATAVRYSGWHGPCLTETPRHHG